MGDIGDWISGWNLLVAWLVFFPVAIAVSVVVAAGQWLINRVRGRRRLRRAHERGPPPWTDTFIGEP